MYVLKIDINAWMQINGSDQYSNTIMNEILSLIVKFQFLIFFKHIGHFYII